MRTGVSRQPLTAAKRRAIGPALEDEAAAVLIEH